MVNYGTGTVSGNGTQVIPDPDPANVGHLYGISHFDWHFPLPTPPNNTNPCPAGAICKKKGDPVDLSSGLMVVSKTDIAFGGARGSLSITRTFRGLTGNPGPFGIGTNHNYGYIMDSSNVTQGLINLIMPDGNQFPFVQQANGTFVNSTIPIVQGAVISNLACITTSYGYGCGGNLRWKNGTTFVFQPLLIGQPWAAFLLSITDTNGNTTTLVHSPNVPMEITQVMDPIGRSLSFVYDNSYRITSITDPIGRSVSYTYNSQGTLASVTDVNGGLTSYSYDGQNDLLSITDPRGITYLQNTYDQNGRVIQQVAADGGVTTFNYTLLNPVVSTTVTLTADVAAGAGGGGGGGGGVVGAAPIPNINTSPVSTTTVTDPLGNVSSYHFNPAGFLLNSTDAMGQTTVYNVDPTSNQILSVTDPLGRTTAYTYDSLGDTTSITQLAGTSGAATTSISYNPVVAKIASITDPLGNGTTFGYDPNTGNLLSIADPLGNQMSFGYDSFGEVVNAADPLGNATGFAYVNGSIATETDPLGRTVNIAADPISRPIAITNSLGESIQRQYNPLGQIVLSTDGLGNRTSFNYDANGNLAGVVDANHHSTTYTYDSMDRIATRTDALGHTESYTHDQDGNLTQFTDRRGIATNYSYDALNRPVQASFGGQSTIDYTYDAASRLTQAVDSVTGAVARSYDGMDRLLSEVTPEGSVNYTYDLAGRRTSMSANGQSPVSYSYDNANRPLRIVRGASGVGFTYDTDSRRTSLTLPNGVSMNYTYDVASQLSAINYQQGSGTLGLLTYTYDMAGRRTAVGGSFARENAPAALSSVTYNAGNQATQSGSQSLTYDANGNLTSDGVNTYTWNARNQLISVTGSVSASYQYDPFGRRVSKTMNGTTSYLYDGMNPVQELSANGTPTANLLTGGADEYFQRTDASGPANFLTDALGSTIELTNPSGVSLAQYTYEPFGNTTLASGSSANPYQFTGRENDAAGLYFYRARFYNPQFGRFVSEDPIKAGINFYAYAGNNPVTFIDFLGFDKKQPCPNPWLRVAAAAGGLGNIALGSAKIALGLGVTAESGGLAVGLGYYSAYSGATNIAGGVSQVYGAITGNLEGGQQGADYAASLSSVSGTITLVATGNAQEGATVSAVEGLAMVGVTGALTSTGTLESPTANDVAATAIDNGSAVFPLIAGDQNNTCH